MTATTPMTVTTAMNFLSAEHHRRLMDLAHEVSFPGGTRLFEEDTDADRFRLLRSGTVALDMRVPGRRSPVIETVGGGDLVGWSWLFPPHVRHLGAETTSDVRAHEFDAQEVRGLCAADPVLGLAVEHWVGHVLAHRLHAARTRLLDLYAA